MVTKRALEVLGWLGSSGYRIVIDEEQRQKDQSERRLKMEMGRIEFGSSLLGPQKLTSRPGLNTKCSKHGNLHLDYLCPDNSPLSELLEKISPLSCCDSWWSTLSETEKLWIHYYFRDILEKVPKERLAGVVDMKKLHDLEMEKEKE